MAKRTDANQAEIVEALKKAGCSVHSTHVVGDGFPDIVCGYAGVNYLFEIKSPGGRLTGKQPEWHAKWKGQVDIVRTVIEALQAIGLELGEDFNVY